MLRAGVLSFNAAWLNQADGMKTTTTHHCTSFRNSLVTGESQSLQMLALPLESQEVLCGQGSVPWTLK